ncbi:hypothetical protein D3C77_524800 [compost metagenome]
MQIIWNKQEVPNVLTSQLNKLAKAVLDSITDSSRAVANVTQWCKREACWGRVKGLNITLDAEIESVLIASGDEKTEVRRARKDQKIVSGIEAQTRVVNYGAEYWKKIYLFVLEKRIPYHAEAEALKIACNMPSKLPNSIHSQKLLSLLERVIVEGWKDA